MPSSRQNPKTTSVTMNLTDEDFENCYLVKNFFKLKNRAESVSRALALLAFFVKEKQKDSDLEILLEKEDFKLYQVNLWNPESEIKITLH